MGASETAFPAEHFTGVVLAGGMSRRFGVPKARIPFDGKPMLSHVAGALRELFPEVLIVTGDVPVPAVPKTRAVRDLLPRKGPLGGIHTALKSVKTPYIFVTACDQPFIVPGLVKALAAAAADCDILVPRTRPFLFPLFAVYSRACLPVIEDHLSRDILQIRRIYPKVRTCYVGRAWLKRHDPDLRSLFNINTPADYEQARRLAEEFHARSADR